MRDGGVMREGARPRRRATWHSNAKQHLTNKWQEAEALAERQKEAIRQHDNQRKERGVVVRQEAEALAEGVGKAERAADKR